MSLLFQRALMLASVEGAFRVAETLNTTDDAILVEDPVFNADTTILDRNNTKLHLSPDPGSPGRKIATVAFTHEARHNGNLDGTVPGKLGVLLQGCGYSETAVTTTGTILDDAPVEVNNPTGSFTYAKTTAYAGSLPRVIELHCTTLGGSGVAVFDVSAPAVGTVQTAIALTAQGMTDATAFQLVNDTPAADAEVTPTVGAVDFAEDDTFIINLSPEGYTYSPVSTGFLSLTIEVFYDGLKHQMAGARGTFTVEGEAGDFAKFNFTFTGDYQTATDLGLPTGSVFETTIPPQVELANLTAAGGENDVDYALCAQSFSIDAGNQVVPRDCINENESLAGGVISSRNPTAGFNPESELEATHPFWSNLDSAEKVSWSVRVGSVQGNVVTFWAPYAQYSSIAYGNRNDIRIYDISMRLNSDSDAGTAGNDELRITFS